MIAGWIFPCPNHRGASGGTQGGAEPVVDNEKKCDGPSLGIAFYFSAVLARRLAFHTKGLD